jgi:hypothetical protein
MNDILSGFGGESATPEKGRATSGGVTQAKPLDYSPPKGPSGQMQQGPGLHGTNHGCSVDQGKH